MSDADVTFAVRDIKSGWAVAEIVVGESSVTLDAFSYITDAFNDLAAFALRAALNDSSAEMTLEREPGGWKLYFGAIERGVCRFDVRELAGWEEKESDLLLADVSRDALARAVLNCFESIETNLGMDAFDAEWMRAYPVRGVAALRAALSVARRPPAEWDN